jgi:hypothetical protein
MHIARTGEALLRRPEGRDGSPSLRLRTLPLILILALVAALAPMSAVAEEHDPNPHFNVGLTWGDLWGHEWTPGATLTIEVDGAVLADDVDRPERGRDALGWPPRGLPLPAAGGGGGGSR